MYKVVKENENFIIEYDELNAIYKVAYFEKGRFKDEISFNAVEINFTEK